MTRLYKNIYYKMPFSPLVLSLLASVLIELWRKKNNHFVLIIARMGFSPVLRSPSFVYIYLLCPAFKYLLMEHGVKKSFIFTPQRNKSMVHSDVFSEVSVLKWISCFNEKEKKEFVYKACAFIYAHVVFFIFTMQLLYICESVAIWLMNWTPFIKRSISYSFCTSST